MLELIRWRDAHFEQDEPETERLDFICETVGWVTPHGVTDDPLYLRIAGEQTPTGDRAISYIPTACILGRFVLSFDEQLARIPSIGV
jgi:hypothetical protein